jgi:hypothetical protein
MFLYNFWLHVLQIGVEICLVFSNYSGSGNDSFRDAVISIAYCKSKAFLFLKANTRMFEILYRSIKREKVLARYFKPLASTYVAINTKKNKMNLML